MRLKQSIQGGGIALLMAATAPGPAEAVETGGAGHATPEQMVEALHSAFGTHHVRAVHAKGIILVGTFTPSDQGKTLSTAPLFAGPQLPVTVRFSDFTGIPNIPDTAAEANPRGLAIKFRLPDGSDTDIVSHSFNGFPTANADEFRQLLLALAASGSAAAKPTPLDTFLGSHPIAKAFLTTQKPAPVSYAALAYFGVNAFKYTNAAGKAAYVRYRFLPVAGEQFLGAEDLARKGPNYLQEEMPARLAVGPVRFDWYAQIAGIGNVIDNPSIAWPESNALVKLGMISVERMASQSADTDRATLFIPSNVPAGIETADPMLDVRSAAYPISFGERQ